MSAQLLPLSPFPNQTITPTLNINGQSLTLNLTFSYNQVRQCWMLNIADRFGVPIVFSVPCLTGDWPAANVLAPYGALMIGSLFFISASGSSSSGDWPNDTNLGSAWIAVWDDNDSYLESLAA